MAVASLAVSNVRRAVWNPTLRKNREGWCPLALACRRRFLISDFLDVAKELVGVTRFKVVIRRFNRRFIGPAQGQNRSGAHPPQSFDNGLFIFERDGMPNNHQVESPQFASLDGIGEADRRFDFKSVVREHQGAGLQ
jgi:hypothetical protein